MALSDFCLGLTPGLRDRVGRCAINRVRYGAIVYQSMRPAEGRSRDTAHVACDSRVFQPWGSRLARGPLTGAENRRRVPGESPVPAGPSTRGVYPAPGHEVASWRLEEELRPYARRTRRACAGSRPIHR